MSTKREVFLETRTITKAIVETDCRYRQVNYYSPETVSVIRKSFTPKNRMNTCVFRVRNVDCLEVACELAKNSMVDDDKVLVLNFANAIQPGGSVRLGGAAQEEELCRRSTLYESLISNAAAVFYDNHIDTMNPMASDAILISPHVRILRNTDFSLLTDFIEIAVISCAAPIEYERGDLSDEEYQEVLYNRILGFLFVASSAGYNKIVLGAWGCGAFGNDARLISELFYKALHSFDKPIFDFVEFAVLDNSPTQHNIHPFKCTFNEVD